MLLLYNETRNKIKDKNNSSNKNLFKIQYKKDNSFDLKENYTNKGLFPNSKTINCEKKKTYFIPKKVHELKDITNFINIQRNKINENKKENLYNNKNKKQYSYTFQNFYNNYPQPEPFPKKIDIRIINNSNDNISSKTIYNERKDKTVYDDKKILFILTNLGLENLYSKFKDNFITYNDLKFLKKDDFVEMKIPIGPRNRIIHFIEEFNKIDTQLDFQELKFFIDAYKKAISGNNFLNKKSGFTSNSSFLISYNENKKDNISIKFNNSDITTIKNNKYFPKSKLENSKYSENNEKYNNIKKNYSIDDREINKYNININHNKKKIKNKNNENNSSSIDIDYYKTNFTNNDESVKYPSSIFDNINNSKTPTNKMKYIYFNKPNTLIRNNTFMKNKGAKIKNKNNKINNGSFSKTLINKLDIINKEVEKYELNYKKLKNETKRRNRNVQRILSNNIFYSKNSNYLQFKQNNNNNDNSYIICHTNNKNDIEEEEVRNIQIELKK